MESRKKIFPVIIQVRLLDGFKDHPHLVDLSRGAVRRVENDLVEDLRLEMPEKPGEDGVFSVEIRPEYLNIPGRKISRLLAVEVVHDEPCRWTKVFCYDNGEKPLADPNSIDNNRGQAKMGKSSFIAIYANRNEQLLICRTWINGKFVKMKPLLKSFNAEMAIGKFSKAKTAAERQEKVAWALDNCATYTEAVIHALRKVWDSNGYYKQVFATYEIAKPASAPAPEKPKVEDGARQIAEAALTAQLPTDLPKTGEVPRVDIEAEREMAKKAKIILTATTDHTDPSAENAKDEKPAKKGSWEPRPPRLPKTPSKRAKAKLAREMADHIGIRKEAGVGIAN